MEEKVGEPVKVVEEKPVEVKVKWKGWGVVIGIAIGVMLTGSIASAVYFYNKSRQVTVLPIVPPETTTVPTERIEPTVEETGIKWTSPPVEISRLDIFQDGEGVKESMMEISDAQFYKVAELSDGSTLINMVVRFGMGGSMVRLVESPEMSYEYLAAYLNKDEKEEISKVLLPIVSAGNQRFEGLETPEEITKEGKTYVMVGYSPFMSFEELENPVMITENLYRVDLKILDGDQVFARVIYLRLKDDMVVPYRLKNIAYPDDHKPYLEWADGGGSGEITFTQAIVSSCSTGMASSVPIIKEGSALLTGKVEVGKWQGRLIYQIKDKESEFVKKLYENYKIGRDYPEADPVVSIEEFASQKNHFSWKDEMGDWQIFVNHDFAPMAECGKPVIYLYPEEKTEVRVEVGADISKSEPQYPETGWQVTAYPGGKLVYQDKEYESLFWEGLGEGEYPDWRNRGTMVRQDEVVGVLNKQLRQLGLNEKEAVDFMEFWQERLPSDSWVRLTWLGTREMNRLAPLTVEPKPDTSIRIFLEFEGMDKPRKLESQKLRAVERKGFVLIEWGGLLIGE